MQTVGIETGETNTVGTTTLARVQTHLTDAAVSRSHEVTKAGAADIGRGALEAVGDVTSNTDSVDHAVSDVASHADVVGLAGETVANSTSHTSITVSGGREATYARRAETIECAGLTVSNQAEWLAAVAR